MIELSITIKDEERRLIKKELIYDNVFALSRDNELLFDKVDALIKEFAGDIELESPDIVIKAKMVW